MRVQLGGLALLTLPGEPTQALAWELRSTLDLLNSTDDFESGNAGSWSQSVGD